jgi:3-oxoacyl-ACP reductase-like protein
MAQFTPPFAEKNAPQAPAAPAAPAAAPQAPAAPAAAPQAAAPAAPAPAAAPAEGEKKKIVRKATRTINKDDIQFVCANVKGMSYNDMAEKLGLTRHQVNRILMDIKSQLRKSFVNADGTEDAKKKETVESYIAQVLSRPEDSRVGAKKGSPVRDAMNDVVSEILNGL